jgi:hypothetical protein
VRLLKNMNIFILTFHNYDKAFASDLYLIYNRSPAARVCKSDTDRLLMLYLVLINLPHPFSIVQLMTRFWRLGWNSNVRPIRPYRVLHFQFKTWHKSWIWDLSWQQNSSSTTPIRLENAARLWAELETTVVYLRARRQTLPLGKSIFIN